MSFWNGMKRAFGFSPEEEEEEGEYDSALPTYAEPAPTQRPVTPVHKPTTENGTPNRNIKKPESQNDDKKEIDSNLPADLFDAIINLFNEQQPDFVKSCLSTDAQRKYIIDSHSDSLKSRLSTGTSEMDVLKKENRRLQLSVDRQKRALLDRINDLEAQIAKYNDEKEKIYTKKKLPVDTEQLDKANAKVAELEEELKNQESIRKQLETKIQMSDVLINDLRNQGAAARKELENAQEEQESVMAHIQEQLDGFEQIKARKNAKIAERDKAIAANEQKIAESEQRIAEYKQIIAESEKRTSELIEENESLRRTIENNLYNQATTERDLRSEIKELKEKLEAATAGNTESQEEASPDERPSKKRGRPKKARIDNTLDNTEWFATGKKEDPDFGYHEPPRRPVNDNEAQLTLF